ncbi:hypothetical protein ACFY05_41875 [Microtetraspora fusca]|uniref:DUF2188 domain-containing protein n=1 Tax=Microtetraspora fusca TaxID=1997 RepID=A0ABW6VJ41_MICFU
MTKIRPLPGHPHWSVLRSTGGRLWATRIKPYTLGELAAGAWRTVDADDEETLAAAITDSEAKAASAPRGDQTIGVPAEIEALAALAEGDER